MFFACENEVVADYFLELIHQTHMISKERYAFVTVNMDLDKEDDKTMAFLNALRKFGRAFGFLNMALSRSHDNEVKSFHDFMYACVVLMLLTKGMIYHISQNGG